MSSCEEMKSSREEAEVWDFYKNESMVREINSIQLDADIDNIVDDIHELIQLHVGDLTKFQDVLKGLKLNIKNLYYSQEDKKEIFSKIKEEDGKDMNVMMVFHKEFIEESFVCKLFCTESYKIYRLKIEMLVTKAGNAQAVDKVNRVVNRAVSFKVNHFFGQFCSPIRK